MNICILKSWRWNTESTLYHGLTLHICFDKLMILNKCLHTCYNSFLHLASRDRVIFWSEKNETEDFHLTKILVDYGPRCRYISLWRLMKWYKIMNKDFLCQVLENKTIRPVIQRRSKTFFSTDKQTENHLLRILAHRITKEFIQRWIFTERNHLPRLSSRVTYKNPIFLVSGLTGATAKLGA